jgi:hypothetical protein
MMHPIARYQSEGEAMFVTVRRYTGCKDPQELNRRVCELVPGVIKTLPGLHSYSIVDHGNGVVATVGIFDTREHAENSANVVRPIVAQHLAELLPNPPEITIAEILSRHLP